MENFLFEENVQLTDDESFLESGILDSTGVLQLIDFLEQEYGIRVENEEVTPDNLDSIERIAAYLDIKLADRNHDPRCDHVETAERL